MGKLLKCSPPEGTARTAPTALAQTEARVAGRLAKGDRNTRARGSRQSSAPRSLEPRSRGTREANKSPEMMAPASRTQAVSDRPQTGRHDTAGQLPHTADPILPSKPAVLAEPPV